MKAYRLIADFYDAYLDDQLYEDFWTLIKKEKQTGLALDLATGTGQMAFKLAENSFHVDATDISLDMLKEAEKRLNKSSLSIKLYVHDVLSPISPNRYDVVTLASDVVNHLCSIEDLLLVFQHVYKALKPGGVFVFDAIHEEYVDGLIGYKDTLKVKGKELHWTVEKDINNSINHVLKVNDEEEILREYLYQQDEITERLLICDFHILEKVRTDERTIFMVKKDK